MDNQRTYLIPETFEDATTEQSIRQIIQQAATDADTYHSQFFDNMVEDYGFWDGERQWMEKVDGVWVDRKAELIKAGRPALTKNFIFPLINLLEGIQADSRLDMKAIGRSSEDGLPAEYMSECMRYVWEQSRGDKKLSGAFKDGNICGRGWIGIEQVDDERTFFGTKTIITRIDPGEILYDPKSKELDLSDADYLIRDRIIGRAKARMLWPDKQDQLQGYFSTLDSSLGSYRTNNIRGMIKKDVLVREFWYRVLKTTSYLIDPLSGQIHDITDIGQAERNAIVKLHPNLQILHKHRKVMKFARTCGFTNDVVLDYGLSPYDDCYFPYVPYFAYRSRSLDFGVVKMVKDPQVEINKRDSQLMAYIISMPKAKIITDDPTLADTFEQGSEIITIQKGATYQVVPPAQMPAALAQIVAQNKDDIKRISSISDDLRGIKSGNDSGVVVDIRRQQAMSSIASLFDNLKSTAELAGRVLMSRIRQYMPAEEIARIIGPKAVPQAIQAIKQKDVEEYDFAIEQTPNSPTLRWENFEKIKQVLGLMPQLLPIVSDIVIDSADIPNKEEWLSRMQQAASQPAPVSGQIPGGNPSPMPDAAGAPSPAPQQ